MRALGNVLWLVFGGLGTAMGYISLGLGYCATIVGIPWGLQAVKLGVACFWPFGTEIRRSKDAGGVFEWVANAIWFVLGGWALALHHLFWALVLALTVVGLPFARQHLKLVALSLWPFGKELR
jgi:uncharacterized membrane protein YccF (DUF307 family)